MKVLWITNITFPEAQQLLDKNSSLESGGGWLIGCSDSLVLQPDVKLFVASVSRRVEKLTRLDGRKITYFLLPKGKGNTRINHDYETLWLKINEDVQPDVVHIHGTEYSHGLAYLDACGSKGVVLSIQGLTSVISRYYYGGIPLLKTILSMTPVSVLLRMNMPHGCKDFQIRGEFEKEMIKRVEHVIGRTTWDKAHVWAINPNAIYHHGGETLRSSFYLDTIWQYNKCIPHSIFVSQASYPIKGLHMLLKAIPLVERQFPDVTVRVAGVDITRGKSLKERIKISDYGNIIRRIIRKNGLQDKVVFTGVLDETGIRKEYLMCNVFVCPSSIENSPNSLGEAQVLGVPSIASYVGGVMDMMKGEECNLYRFEEYEMLAFKIVQLFELEDKVDMANIRKNALKRHDAYQNVKELMNTYNEMISPQS